MPSLQTPTLRFSATEEARSDENMVDAFYFNINGINYSLYMVII